MIRSIIMGALFAVACSGVSAGEPPLHTEEPPPERAEARTEEPAARVADEPPLDPSSACGRALACCRHYASTIPGVVESSACAGVREALAVDDPDRRCRLMSRGWREALTHLEGEPPAACP